jgi:ATP-binding cassette subfamily B protein
MHVIAPISAFANISYSMSGIIPSVKRYFEMMDMPTEEVYGSSKSEQLQLQRISGKLSFDRVNFSYNNYEALRDVSFDIEAGEKVAIVGCNGSGKSTIMNLILRFFDPGDGCILLDNQNINKFKINDYRKIFSVVLQDFFLFNTTVQDNINLLGKIDITSTIQKNKHTTGYRFFMNMIHQCEDSIIGFNGAQLSGGERQKVALIRALINDATIYLMDEATANMDIGSELSFNNLIFEELKNKTVIIITHQTEILKKMDKIILLDQGKVIDIGTHQELLDRSFLYKNMLYKIESNIEKEVV